MGTRIAIVPRSGTLFHRSGSFQTNSQSLFVRVCRDSVSMPLSISRAAKPCGLQCLHLFVLPWSSLRLKSGKCLPVAERSRSQRQAHGTSAPALPRRRLQSRAHLHHLAGSKHISEESENPVSHGTWRKWLEPESESKK